MKTTVLVTLIIALALLSLFQQSRIAQLHNSIASDKLSPAPEITYKPALLAAILTMPDGAADASTNPDSHKLTGNSYADVGFDGCLWIDVTHARYPAAAPDAPPASSAAEHYARQIAAAIPSAYIERAIEQPGFTESGSLHSTYVVRHPWGHIIISAGFTASRDNSSQIGSVVKVHVISVNNSGNGRTEISPAVPPISIAPPARS